MTIERTQAPVDNTRVARPAIRPDAKAAHGPSYAADQATFGHGATGGDEASVIDDVAHGAHSPHGAFHALETGEKVVAGATELAAREGRLGSLLGRLGMGASHAAASGAEIVGHGTGAQHHGLVGRAEAFLEHHLDRLTGFLGRQIARVPGGERFLSAGSRALGAPGRWMGPSVDAALEGTKLGGAIRLTGAGGRLTEVVGGRIPLIGALAGGLIGAVDARNAWKTLRDPHASTRDKVLHGAQGLFSAVSGAVGLGALGGAAMVALGRNAPFSIPFALTIAAVTGLGAFALSFFTPKSHH